MFADAQKVYAVSVQAGGSGYLVGDILFASGGLPLTSGGDWSSWGWCWPFNNNTGTNSVTWPGGTLLQVSAIGAGGSVATAVLIDPGSYYTLPLNPNTVLGGNGSGCVLTLSFELYWNNQPWYVPFGMPITYPGGVTTSATDILNVLTSEVLIKFDANIIGGIQQVGTPIDYSLPTRSGNLLLFYVNQVRQAIQTGNKVPLSIQNQAIPPEAIPHVLNLAAWQLVNSTPSLQFAVYTEKAVYAPLGQLAKEGMDWMEKVRKGLTVTYPADPDPTWNSSNRTGSAVTPAYLESYSVLYNPSFFPVSQIGFP